MTAGDNVSEAIQIMQLKLQIEQEQTKREKIKTKAILEQEKTKQLELEERKRKSTKEIEESKRMKILNEQSSSSKKKRFKAAMHNRGFFDIYARNNVQLLEIQSLLNVNNKINDDMMYALEKCFLPLKLCDKKLESSIQAAFDMSLNNLFNELSDLTSLKYLNTSHCCYLEGKAPDCSFVFKNINILKDNQIVVLKDFIVCLGELKRLDGNIVKEDPVGQVSRYLNYILDEQNREKIYGYLTNAEQIIFYCLQKKPMSDLYDYYESKPLDFFIDLPKTSSSSSSSSSVAAKKKSKQSNKIHLNSDTLKVFIKFLTMDWEFYGCTMLNISPNDRLHEDIFNIESKAGSGLTSIVYVLNQNTNVNTDQKRYVIKISKHDEYSNYFKNEVKMLEPLKQSNDSINFKKYFENIFASSPTGNFIIFENYLTPLNSLTLIQSQQLINIIEYLYNCHIIHRDLRPDNLMLDFSQQHLKLIDFGFATTYEIDEMPKKLPIEGVVSYAGLKFLDYYYELLSNHSNTFYYYYERTFDLQCAINIMMYLTDDNIKNRMISIKQDLCVKSKVLKLYQLWLDITLRSDNCSELLKLIKSLKESPNFDVIKCEIEKRLVFVN
ncbi:unnamed protein product [Rotaria sp. Silwood2]|nr:unnamed protein product [Rotaria sp. Silwood2]